MPEPFFKDVQVGDKVYLGTVGGHSDVTYVYPDKFYLRSGHVVDYEGRVLMTERYWSDMQLAFWKKPEFYPQDKGLN